jgi:hypothetical protein
VDSGLIIARINFMDILPLQNLLFSFHDSALSPCSPVQTRMALYPFFFRISFTNNTMTFKNRTGGGEPHCRQRRDC